ncbi:unnamed protein product [Calicophoron daubneyi]|uniref:L-type lectin-like domain-containing protein n=1 Tax=Calicophoron daubneyi TaxID=300641 RepID=A0AAV2T3Q9_CALDB
MLQSWVFLWCLLSSVLSYSTYEKKEHSLHLPHQIANWYSYGSTIIQPDHISLTKDQRSQRGGIYSTMPVVYRDWEVQLAFHVHGAGTTLFGDGLAFWYIEKPPSEGSAFGNQDVFRGLGVFFDTYANQNGAHSHEHPYISAMVNDGSKKYDHDKDGTLTELAGCSTDFRNHKPAVAIIRFVKNQLSVSMKYDGTDKEVDCFVVDDVRLPIGYYFGVSAETGDLSDNHDILSISTYQVDVPRSPEELAVDAALIEPSAGHEAPMRDRVDDQPVSRSWSLLYWLIILAILGGCAYLARGYYRRRQRQLKRLY